MGICGELNQCSVAQVAWRHGPRIACIVTYMLNQDDVSRSLKRLYALLTKIQSVDMIS